MSETYFVKRELCPGCKSRNSKALYAKLARRILDHNDQHLWDWKESKWLLYERKLYEKIKPVLNGRTAGAHLQCNGIKFKEKIKQ